MNSDHVTRRSWLAGATIAATHLAKCSNAAVSSDPLEWSLIQAADGLQNRTVSSEELTKLCLARIHELEPQLNAVITLQEETALAQARECDRRRAAGNSVGPLQGIPVALKDNIDTAGVRTTAAANVFKDRVPAEDAEVTRRLKAAGVVFLGKLNLDERGRVQQAVSDRFTILGTRQESRVAPPQGRRQRYQPECVSDRLGATTGDRSAYRVRFAAWSVSKRPTEE